MEKHAMSKKSDRTFRSLRKIIGEYCASEAIEDGYLQLAIDDLEQELAAAQSESGWVSIADIPEEWKDGRPVDLLETHGNAQSRDPNCRWLQANEDRDLGEQGEGWFGFGGDVDGLEHEAYSHDVEDITHAMLPPTPPKKEE